MAAPFGTDGAGWGYAHPHHSSAPFPGPVWRSPSSEFPKRNAGGWLSSPVRRRRRMGLSCQPAACWSVRKGDTEWPVSACLSLLLVRLPTFGRLAWFIITRPGDLRLCCLYFWDNTRASRGDARQGYLLPIAALNYEDGWYHQQCCKACRVRRKFGFWVCLVGTPWQLDLVHWARCRKWMG